LLSKWAGKYVIGLTGNIGTGKSVVRKMLEHLGAYGIDADTLGHRVLARGSPGYQPVVEHFGRWILGPDGEIDRSHLGKLVFRDPMALEYLEKIVHPIVVHAVDLIIQRAKQRVIVIEAIKLIEAGMVTDCDALWVTWAPFELQMARLLQKRNMSEEDARARILAQPPQESKTALAKVVIKNNGTFEETWKQVVDAWKKTFSLAGAGHERPTVVVPRKISFEDLSVVRGKPLNSSDIASLYNRIKKDGMSLTRDDIMAVFGERAFLLLYANSNLVGVVGWQVENLVARTQDVAIDPQVPLQKALPLLIKEMEKMSAELQCEVSLVFVPPEIAGMAALWQELGYEALAFDAIKVPAWQEAIRESGKPGTQLLLRQLRKDRILKPF
jgi:dephospho-CoA kinase